MGVYAQLTLELIEEGFYIKAGRDVGAIIRQPQCCNYIIQNNMLPSLVLTNFIPLLRGTTCKISFNLYKGRCYSTYLSCGYTQYTMITITYASMRILYPGMYYVKSG